MTAADPDTALPLDPAIAATRELAPPGPWRRFGRGLRNFVRRSPLSAFWGVVAAALLVGLVKGVMVGIGYSAASTAAIYLLMLLVLLFRPRGLFGERIMRFE